jgi:hypothetical protein
MSKCIHGPRCLHCVAARLPAPIDDPLGMPALPDFDAPAPVATGARCVHLRILYSETAPPRCGDCGARAMAVIVDHCETIEDLRAQFAAAESRAAHLRDTIERIGARAREASVYDHGSSAHAVEEIRAIVADTLADAPAAGRAGEGREGGT